MNKYKDIYRVYKQKSVYGKNSENIDDCYILCKANAQIYRYSKDMLAIQFNSNIYARNRIKELESIGIQINIL